MTFETFDQRDEKTLPDALKTFPKIYLYLVKWVFPTEKIASATFYALQ